MIYALFKKTYQKRGIKMHTRATWFHKRSFATFFKACIFSPTLLFGGGVLAQTNPIPPSPQFPGSLKDTAVPPVPGIEKYIRDKKAAIALGKALFWDQNTGSDGMACASCHFQAGADNRLKNQLNPKGNGIFDRPSVSAGWGPNYTLTAADFPLHRLSDLLDRNSTITSTTDDVVGSSGTQSGSAMNLLPKVGIACSNRPADDLFHVDRKLTRLTTGRNAPTVINAVFNFRNFWDGRANNVFNGSSPFGSRDMDAGVFEQQADGSELFVKVNLINSSLASQAVGPALNTVEMTCTLEGFKQLGRKLSSLRPLMNQTVAADDSVLASYRYPTGAGLSATYGSLVKKAFDPKYWGSKKRDADGYTQFERNFSLFWGLAIQAYESTLVSDDTPWDRFVGSKMLGIPKDSTALTSLGDPDDFNKPSARRGLDVFMGKGKCIACHKGAEFTNAATRLQPENKEQGLVERMRMKNENIALYDNGFYNIGVRPTADDLGVGGTDPFNNPLSWTRQYANAGFPRADVSIQPDKFQINPCTFEVLVNSFDCSQPPAPGSRVAVDGAFKTPTLRNVALTAPYFHDGGQSTLEQVVEFYNRGGNHRGQGDDDTTGFGQNGSNIAPDITVLGMTAQEQADLVAFMRYALTDRRVACEMEPFDHPSLKLINGHLGDELTVQEKNGSGMAEDDTVILPATGRNGLPAAGKPCYLNDKSEQLSSINLPASGNNRMFADQSEFPPLAILGLAFLSAPTGLVALARRRNRMQKPK
jgi:cytochrome c peroxidase